MSLGLSISSIWEAGFHIKVWRNEPAYRQSYHQKLLFGMDICSPEGERSRHNRLSGFLRDMLAKGDITEAVFNKVVRGNAERILGV